MKPEYKLMILLAIIVVIFVVPFTNHEQPKTKDNYSDSLLRDTDSLAKDTMNKMDSLIVRIEKINAK